jgi:HlyD family secretion protein
MDSKLASPAPGAAMDRVIVRKPGRRWIPVAAGAAALVCVIAAYLVISPPGARAIDAKSVEVTTVRQAAFHDFVPARASVVPRATVYLDAVEGGRVERLVAADGALVRAGDLLAELSNPQLALAVGSREADISGRLGDARGQLLQMQRDSVDRERELAQARFDLLKAEQNLGIRERLHSQGFVSDAEISTLTAEANHHRQRVKALEASIQPESRMMRGQAVEIQQTQVQLRDNLASVRGSLDALKLRAPVAGRLTAFDLQPGQTVTAGQRVGQIDSEGEYKLTADVDEYYLGRVNPSQVATARYEDKTYQLAVSRILPQVRQGRFQIELTFSDSAPPSLRRGQSLDLELTLGATRPAIVVPNGPFMQATGGTWIFVVGPDNRRATRRAIRVGRRNPQDVEVLSGLRPGERVLTSSYDGFAQETRLTLR